MLPSDAAADAALELRDDVRRETRAGNVGNGRSSTMPIISQWPVTESLPADASAMRPNAPRGASAAPATPPSVDERGRGRARAASAAAAERARAMLPSVLLPWSPYAAASGSSPMPTLSSTMTMTRRNGGVAKSRRY